MQSLSWDNYQYVLAIHRCQTLAGAARSLGVNETTVSRRLVQTERQLQVRLFSRRSSGLVATDKGLKLILRLERVKFELDEAQAEIATSLSVVGGALRVASDLLLLNHMLVPSLNQLLDKNPALACELVTVGSCDPLKDCDIAIRYNETMSEIETPASDYSLHLGSIEFGIFASASASASASAGSGSGSGSGTGTGTGTDASDADSANANADANAALDSIPWIVRSEHATTKSHKAPRATAAQASATNTVRVRTASDETLLSCVHAGLGKCLLPMGVGLRHPELTLLQSTDPIPPRDVVRVCQSELIGTDRLAVCDEWLLRCVEAFNSPNG